MHWETQDITESRHGCQESTLFQSQQQIAVLCCNLARCKYSPATRGQNVGKSDSARLLKNACDTVYPVTYCVA